MGDLPETVDVAIIGSGIGGSTIAYGLAGSGARIAVLERGSHLGAHPAARDARAIFQRLIETAPDPATKAAAQRRMAIRPA